MSGGDRYWRRVAVEENEQRKIEMKIHQLEGQIAAVKRNQLLSGVSPFQSRRLVEEEADLNRSLGFEKDALVEKKAKVATRRAEAERESGGMGLERAHVDLRMPGPARGGLAEGFERRFERGLNELLRPAERGFGVHGGGGLDSPFVDRSMSGPQRRRGEAVESAYVPRQAGGGLDRSFWDTSMSRPQRRPGQVLRSSYEESPSGVVESEFKW